MRGLLRGQRVHRAGHPARGGRRFPGKNIYLIFFLKPAYLIQTIYVVTYVIKRYKEII